MIRLRTILAAAASILLAACATAPARNVAADAPATALLPADPAAFFNCLRENRLAIIGAHRMGYSANWPENSRLTAEHLLAQAPAILEMDVRRTRDGVLMVMHDDDLSRTTTGAGQVDQLEWAAMKSFRLKAENGRIIDETIPSLADALAWSKGKAMLQLDVKRGVPFADVTAAIAAADAEARVVVIVYSIEDAIAVAKLNPRVMQSVSIRAPEELDALRAGGVDLSRVLAFTGTRNPNPALYEQLRAVGVEVIFGTLGRRGESWDDRFAAEGDAGYARFAEAGVQVIATNRGAPAALAIDAWDGPGFAPAKCLGAKP
jgi:glycerophosphoryl diester phosphodiesterase